MFVLCVGSVDRKAKCRAMKTKKTVRMKYEQSTTEYNKKNPLVAWMFVSCVLCRVGRGLCNGPITCQMRPTKCVCGSRVIKCNNNPLHLQWDK
jgi:hypothetical protein